MYTDPSELGEGLNAILRNKTAAKARVCTLKRINKTKHYVRQGMCMGGSDEIVDKAM